VADARRVFACFDQPDLKATFQLTVLARTTGRCSPTRSPPSPAGLGRVDAAAWAFEATPPVSTYITALVAGAYHVQRDVYRRGEVEIPMAVACRASLAEHLDAAEIFDVTKRGFDFFLELFASPTRSPSTTSCSCRSTTRARWRTRAA